MKIILMLLIGLAGSGDPYFFGTLPLEEYSTLGDCLNHMNKQSSETLTVLSMEAFTLACVKIHEEGGMDFYLWEGEKKHED